MADNQIDEKMVLALGKAIQKAYPTYHEFVETLDELNYALFYFNTDEVSTEKQRDFAFLIRTLKRGIQEPEC